MIMQNKRASTIGRLESQVQPKLRRDVSKLIEDSRSFTSQSRSELQELGQLMDALDNSNKRLEDNKRIIQTLADLMPPYVAKIRDVETEFEDFEHNFPKLEETVKTLQTRSTQTSDDIDTLRQQVGTLTQRQEAFTKLSLLEMEGLLQEIVGGKRLSASKLTKFQEMVMKSLKHDTKIVTMLYRTHKSLPKNQKVSSLYVFDALARAAKHQASKHSLAIKEIPSDKPGNAGTFLFKLEGILDGLIEDMIKVGTPEAMEKTRKVLDIWKKANTFPADVLSRLLQSVDQGGQGAYLSFQMFISNEYCAMSQFHPISMLVSRKWPIPLSGQPSRIVKSCSCRVFLPFYYTVRYIGRRCEYFYATGNIRGPTNPDFREPDTGDIEYYIASDTGAVRISIIHRWDNWKHVSRFVR
ncbi:hypothetical protein FRC15_004865 [Serendipita sp. 397]|nr:hypothetical protein FRC15_004865 [Serendipita sp. 397]